MEDDSSVKELFIDLPNFALIKSFKKKLFIKNCSQYFFKISQKLSQINTSLRAKVHD